ncbi:hypothetical protein UPYG_G00092170 [Umbra pygmaea]|uniref:Stabilin-1 n=1 Tax=Umbra pygmaea TaxID=75934 RepID=A0ABD0XG13_UMBPY
MQPTGATMPALLLFLGTMVTCSLQLQIPPNRCDETIIQTTTTPCTSCAASKTQRCPQGFKKHTAQPVDTTMGQEGCVYTVTIANHQKAFSGCNHKCERTSNLPKCCPEFWGPLCLSCPSWNGKTCNWHGTCTDGISGNGACVCNEGFTGFACQQCTNKNAYGERCKSECDCVNGECNNGPDGDGECYCQPPFTGSRCDQVSSACKNCTAYSHCKGRLESAVCQCLPGFQQTGDRCSGVCSNKQCDVNAECSWLGGRLFQCRCKTGYEGDGRVCVPINPCNKDNGGCPQASTVCVYTSPGRSRCECMHGWKGSIPSSGCALQPMCNDTTCHRTATCQTGLDGYPRCVCEDEQIGDGYRCYGNLMARLLELSKEGAHKGKLSGAISLFEKGCSLTLSQQGPLTVFVPLLKTPLVGVAEDSVCQLHLLRGQHSYNSLEGTDPYTASGLQLRFKPNKQFIVMKSPDTLYSVIDQDIPAADGVIHIIDKPIMPRNSAPDSPKNNEFIGKSIGEILTLDSKYNRFLSLVDNCGIPLPLRGPGPLTVFVPTNDAVDSFRDGRLIYMLHNAQNKLQELLKHHIYNQAVLDMNQLASMTQIQSTANQILLINLTADGKVLVDGKHLQTTNIMASNGVIHMIDGLLVPPSIMPILPNMCDVTESKIIPGPCVRCSYLYETQCPEGTTELQSHLKDCEYHTIGSPWSNKGCAKYCNVTTQRAECCSGFYGPDCKPCIGGFQKPCYGKGTCFDGIHGNGSCSCKEGFKGIACHICSDPKKHGEQCDQECRCLHGVCDNRPGSNGVCRAGTCLKGYSGQYCDKEAKACNSDGLSEHCHVDAYCSNINSLPTCVCLPGYEGDGHACTLVNPCLKADRGGCDHNALCVSSGPAVVSCVCNEGWTGDGLFCVEVDNCLLDSRGGCHKDADCRSLGPGQSECNCKRGYMGDGKVCDLINPCKKRNGGCHSLAKCTLVDQGNHTCVCPQGYAGDGVECYGMIAEELEINPSMYSFNRWIQRSLEVRPVDLTGNVTALVPSREAIRNLTSSEDDFWLSRYRISHLVKAHFLQGVFSIEDLDTQVNKRVPTLNSPTTWMINTVDGKIRIENATILTRNIPAINGYIHIIDKVLFPSVSDIPPEPPSLMQYLNNTPTFSLFRQAALLYNLTNEIGVFDYTLLIPHDSAIQDYLIKTNSTQLSQDVLKYHVILNEQLFPDHLSNGMVKSTLLGKDYHIMFHLDQNNETLANDVLLNVNYKETRYGVVMGISQVLQIHRNRCSQDVVLRVRGKCSACDETPTCLFNYKPIYKEFPAKMKSNCKYRKRVANRRKTLPGCVNDCLKTTQDHSCCSGYFGHDCFRCPGEKDNWCSGNGRCKDGIQGTGECLCNEGFHGTACESCEPGRYGKDCKSVCSCTHGKCLDGVTGDGRCVCNKGWKGVDCSKVIVSDACGGICDENANCILGEVRTEGPKCQCISGFTGNGTSCTEVNPCAIANGGCHRFANCTKTLPGERTCICQEGYTGDGEWCKEINLCLHNNGGCSSSAVCFQTGLKEVKCGCQMNFVMILNECFPTNPCRRNNGGCAKFARCHYLGDGRKYCSCIGGFVGDGETCHGSTRMEINHKAEASLYRQIISGVDFRSLYGDGPFNTFIPANDSNFSIEAWNVQGRSLDLANYHIVSCGTLMLADLKNISTVVAMSGHQLTFSFKNGSVYINNDARIISSDYLTTDGVIHYIDKVLTPYDLTKKTTISDKLNFTEAAEQYGYREFSKLVKDANMLSLVESEMHKPLTMLWPSDAALRSLTEERKRWLYSSDHRDKLISFIKAHIIRNIKKMTLTSLTDLRTMHGSTISLSCDKNVLGGIMVNDNMARFLDRFLIFKGGVAYGIDQLLEPPGLGAHCDGLEYKTTYSLCGSLFNLPNCPRGSEDTGKKDLCRLRYHSRYPSRRKYSFYGPEFSQHPMYGATGFRRVCNSTDWIMRCCKNHFGRDCQVCPGGLEDPCGAHGECADGRIGSGHCRCHNGFIGTACEMCEPEHYGNNCTECTCSSHGRCDDGIEGDGSCSCRVGWTGDNCNVKIEKKLVCSPECHDKAVCQPDNVCVCRSQYVGDGWNCTAPDLCAEDGGRCHQHATCLQTDLQVNCTCLSGYEGDGFVCSPINRCYAENNGGCSDFATCLFTGPNERQCQCLDGYIGNGVQCLEKVVPPVDRCLEDNGGCDPQAICKDLHYHTNTAGVFHLRSKAGRYKFNYTEAEAACQAEEATLATFAQMSDAQQLGMHHCVAGWMEEKKVGYPTTFPSVKCGDNHVGIVLYKDPVDLSLKYDAYCYRVSDVSCVCGSGYVGNGEFCNGDMASVLATNTNFSVFYNILLKYSDSTTKGESLLNFLSTSSSNATLFVPHNAGFSVNETLSDRDVEYHISTNNSVTFYEDMEQNGVIPSRLGFNLSVGVSSSNSTQLNQDPKTFKLVNKRLVLDWNIPALNGIIHVIESPFRAPPLPTNPGTSSEQRGGTAATSILVTCLMLCLVSGLAYYVFKHKNDAFRFQYFKNEDDAPHTNPALVSIPNPLYSGSSNFNEPFDQQCESGAEEFEQQSEPESPNLLDI